MFVTYPRHTFSASVSSKARLQVSYDRKDSALGQQDATKFAKMYVQIRLDNFNKKGNLFSISK